MFVLKAALTFATAATALLGDYMVFQSKITELPILKALLDNLVHAAIGFLSSLTFFTYDLNVSKTAMFYNVLLCTFISSCIDVDHAILAWSLRIKDMTHLNHRGFLHCSSLWVLIATSLFVYSHITKQLRTFLVTWMVVIAFTSHHYRDGNRRGLWMFPFGNTSPLSRPLYITLTVISPYLFSVVYKRYRSGFYTERILEYTVA